MKGTGGHFVAVSAVALLFAACGICIPAHAASIKLDCPTSTLGGPSGGFSVECTLTHNGQPGTAVITVTPGVNTGGLSANPSVITVDKNETLVFGIVGTLANPRINGTFNVDVVVSKNNKLVHLLATITVLAAVPT